MTRGLVAAVLLAVALAAAACTFQHCTTWKVDPRRLGLTTAPTVVVGVPQCVSS